MTHALIAFTDIFLADLDQILPQLNDEVRTLTEDMRQKNETYWRGLDLRRWVEQKYCDGLMSHRRHLDCSGKNL